MADMTDKSSLEQLLRPLRRGLNAELAALLLRMHAEDEVQARYEVLAERNTEGQLSPGEREELALMVRANALLSVLKAEARAFLQHSNACIDKWMRSCANPSARCLSVRILSIPARAFRTALSYLTRHSATTWRR